MGILESLIVIILVLWLAGFALSIGGGLIHLLLVIAILLIIFRLIRGGKSN